MPSVYQDALKEIKRLKRVICCLIENPDCPPSFNSLESTNITISNLASGSFTATWTAVPNAVDYDASIGSDANGLDAVLQYSGTNLTYNFTNFLTSLTLSPGVVYYVSVVARDATGSSSVSIVQVILPATDPTFLAGQLLAWYDATDQATVHQSSNFVSQWDDKSGNTHHLTQAFGPFRPINHTSGGSNNKAYIDFTGTSLSMDTTLAHASPFGFFFMLQVTTPYAGLVHILHFTVNLYDAGLAVWGNTYNGIFRNFMTSANNAQYAGPVVNTYDLNWNVWQNVQNVGSALIKNGGDIVTGAGGAGNAMTDIHLGDPNVNNTFKISELIVHSGLLDATQANAISLYLLNKYQISSLETTPITPLYPALVAFGDSITNGQMADYVNMDAFVPLIAFSKGYVIKNFGTPGSTVYGSVDPTLNFTTQVNQGLDPRYVHGYVIIQYGSNDSQLALTPEWSTLYKAGIQRLIDYGYSKSKIILATQPYQPTLRPGGIQYVAAAQQVATDLGIAFYNAWDYMGAHGGESLLVDGIHPTSAGHQVYADGAIPYFI